MCERSGDVESIRLTKTWDKVNESLDGETWRCCRRVGELIPRIESNVTRWGANVEWPKKKKKNYGRRMIMAWWRWSNCAWPSTANVPKNVCKIIIRTNNGNFFFFFGERSNSIANRYRLIFDDEWIDEWNKKKKNSIVESFEDFDREIIL